MPKKGVSRAQQASLPHVLLKRLLPSLVLLQEHQCLDSMLLLESLLLRKCTAATSKGSETEMSSRRGSLLHLLFCYVMQVPLWWDSQANKIDCLARELLLTASFPPPSFSTSFIGFPHSLAHTDARPASMMWQSHRG